GAPAAAAAMGGGGDGGGGTPWLKYVGIGCGVMFLLSCLLWGGCYACNMCAASAVEGAAQQAQADALAQAAAAQQQAAAQQAAAQQAAAGGTAPAAGGTAPAAGGAGGVCGRAGDCCTAYVDAITNAQGNIAAQAMAGSMDSVRQACASYGQMGAAGAAAEPGCQSAIDGYRTGLAAMSIAVPAACQ
ncbi:MAG: hypothetical protein J0L92_36310, partial [Deltaproteobacteria bacterium]|nr:hypothetical protein [Deltaproteobacteria bacterium]